MRLLLLLAELLAIGIASLLAGRLLPDPWRGRVQNTLKAIYQADPATWNTAVGVAAAPITGSYVGGIPYAPFRSGGGSRAPQK